MASKESNRRCDKCGRTTPSSMNVDGCVHCLLQLAADFDPSKTQAGSETHATFSKQGVVSRFDDYQLLEEIDRGGMGVVYRAEQISLRREVAVKMIRDGHLATPESLRRFQIEAEAAARLDHPFIVPIYEIGESDSQHYFSMKLVEGSNLAEVKNEFCLQSKSSTRERRTGAIKLATLISKVATALAFAHEHGVLHRDLKPTNILIDHHRDPHLTDFGLAKLSGRNEGNITQSSTILGSPSYMSPEQAMGDPSKVTTLADVYGVGAILYELLSGQPPFSGPTALDTVQQVIQNSPTKPRVLNPHVPPDLETIALKCLERDPSQRYANATELARELERFSQGQPILARPIGLSERCIRWCRQNPSVASLLLALVFVTVVGFVAVTWKWRDSEFERKRADANAKQAQEERDEARWQAYRSNLSVAVNALRLRQMTTLAESLESAPPEYRNWEWRYFSHQLLTPEQRRQTATDSLPSRLWFSDDGKRLVCVRSDEFTSGTHAAIIWHLDTGEVDEFQPDSLLSHDLAVAAHSDAHRDMVIRNTETNESVVISPPGDLSFRNIVGFSRNNTWLATRTLKGVDVWNTESGEHQFHWPGALNAYFGPRFFGDHQRQFLFNGERELIVFDPRERQLLDRWEFTGGEIHTLAFNASSGLIATAEEYPRNIADIWDANTGKKNASLPGHQNVIYRMKFNDSGSLLATGSLDTTVRIWDLETLREKLVLRGHSDTILDIAFGPKDDFLATASADLTVRVWDLANGRVVVAIPMRSIPHKVAFHPGGRLVATASETGELETWDLQRHTRQTLTAHESFVYGIDLASDGSAMATASWDGTIRIWALDSDIPPRAIPVKDKIAHGVRFSRDAKRLAYATPNVMGVVDVDTGETLFSDSIRNYDIGTKAGVRPAFSPDGVELACGNLKEVKIWNTQTGKRVHALSGHDDIVTDCLFSSDGRTLISIGGSTIRFWNAEDYSRSTTIKLTDTQTALAVSSDDQWIAVASFSSLVRLFDFAGTEIGVLQHPSTVYSLAFSPDKSRLFTACHDSTIRVWDLRTFESVAVLHGHTDYVHGLAVSPDGTTLVSGSGDHTVRIWSGDDEL